MTIDPAAILALISDLTTRLATTEEEVASLRERLAVANSSQQAQ